MNHPQMLNNKLRVVSEDDALTAQREIKSYEALERMTEENQRLGLYDSDETVECNPHPDAPHGFDRDSSHNMNRYVCECESWEGPEDES